MQKADRLRLTIRLRVLGLVSRFRSYAATGPRIFDPWRHHQMLLNMLRFICRFSCPLWNNGA